MNFDKFEALFVSMDVFRDTYIDLRKISFINIKILLFMFKSPNSNNIEKNKYCPLSLWDAPGKNYSIEFL